MRCTDRAVGPAFGGAGVSVDRGAMTKVDVCNVIPAMKAGRIVEISGGNEGNWAPNDPASMRSAIDANIHVLGDAEIAGDMPKSGFSANSQAKVAAMPFHCELTSSNVFPAKYANTCWSLIGTDDGVKVGASCEATVQKIAKVDGVISQTGEDAELRKRTCEESLGWYAAITTEMSG